MKILAKRPKWATVSQPSSTSTRMPKRWEGEGRERSGVGEWEESGGWGGDREPNLKLGVHLL